MNYILIDDKNKKKVDKDKDKYVSSFLSSLDITQHLFIY